MPMARSLRIEYPGAVYHVINRGNYRQDLFKDEGTHWAFEQCLFEACERNGWVLEGFCVMTNHFHLILRTPMGNLSEGMRWLQSTFANRFNRHREETGRLFQGRFKSLVVEEAHYLGTLLDYVHLNPSRAGLVPVDRLFDYRWSSYYYFWNPQKRPGFLNVAGALQDTKGCDDTLLGRREYAGHLAWLMATPEAREDAGFNRLSRGWALGSKEFKRSLIEQLGEGGTPTSTNGRVHFEGTDLEEANQLWWEHCLQRCLAATDCSLADALRIV